MSFWPFRKTNELKNCVVNTKSKFPNTETDSSKKNVFEATQPVANEADCTEEYFDFSLSHGVMERLKGGHFLKPISHGIETGNLNLATPNKNEIRQQQVFKGIENPQEFKRILKELMLNSNALYHSFSQACKSPNSSSNSITSLEQKFYSCFESAGLKQLLGPIDLVNTCPINIFYVEVKCNDEDKRASKAENSSRLRQTNVSKKCENQSKRPEPETSSARCRQRDFSNSSRGDINIASYGTCPPIKLCYQPMDCNQPILCRCVVGKENPTCSNTANIGCAKHNTLAAKAKEEEKCQQSCKPSKHCCKRVAVKQNCSCECKRPIIYSVCAKPQPEKSKGCKELEAHLKSTKKREIPYDNKFQVKRESSTSYRKETVYQSVQSAKDRPSLRKSSEYEPQDAKSTEKETPSAEEPFNSSRENEKERCSRLYQTEEPKSGRSSYRKSNEYRQQDDYIQEEISTGSKLSKESFNNLQESENVRSSQTERPSRSSDIQNERSSLRDSSEYKQQNDYPMESIEEEIPQESTNDSERDTNGRASQTQQPDKPLDLINGRSSFRKTEDEIPAAEYIQRGSSSSSKGDARISQTSQSLKASDHEEEEEVDSGSVHSSLEEIKRDLSEEEVSAICQPIRYTCKPLDCSQYPPCMVKPKGYKQPILFSCTPCSPKETVCGSGKFQACKELAEYLRNVKKNAKRESSKKEAFDPKEERPSLRKSIESKQRDSYRKSVEWENGTQENEKRSSSLRKSSEYKQRKDYVNGEISSAQKVSRGSSNNNQENTSGRVSQTYSPIKTVDIKNERSSLRKSSEYRQENDYLMTVEEEIPRESTNNSQRDTNGRISQTQQPDNSLDPINGRSSLKKSSEYKQQENYIETEDAEYIQRGSSKSSQGDARLSQRSQSLKSSDHDEEDDSGSVHSNLEDRKRDICQPIRYTCKPLDCSQYPPCMIKPKGYKQPILFSCRPCSPKETECCSEKPQGCKELKEYLKCVKKNEKRESSKEDRPSLRKSTEYRQRDSYRKSVERENGSQEEPSGRVSQTYQATENLDSKKRSSSLRKSSEYEQREVNGEISSARNVRSSNNNSGDANERASLTHKFVEGRSSLRKSNEYKPQEDYVKANRFSKDSQGDANGRESQTYQTPETVDSKNVRSSLRKSNEYRQPEDDVKTADGIAPLKNVQRASSNNSRGDARISQTSQPYPKLHGSEEELESDNSVCEQTLDDSQSDKYCFEPIELEKCPPCLSQNNTCKQPPRMFRCWPYNSNQDCSSEKNCNPCNELQDHLKGVKGGENMGPCNGNKKVAKVCCRPLDCKQDPPCLKKINECKQPIIVCCKRDTPKSASLSSENCKAFKISCEKSMEDECGNTGQQERSCVTKIKFCKLPEQNCCKPCQPKAEPIRSSKTSRCKEPIKCCDSEEEMIELMKAEIIQKLVDFVKDLKVQLNMQKECNRKSDESPRASRQYECNDALQVKKNPDEDCPDLLQNTANDREMPPESYKARQQETDGEVTPSTTNTHKKSSYMGQEVSSNETPHLPATVLQTESSETVQQDLSSDRKKGGCSSNTSQCQCQQYEPDELKLNAPWSRTINTEDENPEVRDIQNDATNAGKQHSKAMKVEKGISKKKRIESSEKGSQTDQPINMQTVTSPQMHRLSIAPICLTIPLKFVINAQEGQSNIVETDIIFEATSGGDHQESCMAASKTPIMTTRHVPDDSEGNGFHSALSDPGIKAMQSLATAEQPQNIAELEKLKTDATVTEAPINTDTHRQTDKDSDESKSPRHVQDNSENNGFQADLLDSGRVEVQQPLATAEPQNIAKLENLQTDATVTAAPINTDTHRQSDNDSDKSKGPRHVQDNSENNGFQADLSDSGGMEVQQPLTTAKPQNIEELEKFKSGAVVPQTLINTNAHMQSDGSKTPPRHVQDDNESKGFHSRLSDSGGMEVQSLAVAKPQNIVELEKLKSDTAVPKTPINTNTHKQSGPSKISRQVPDDDESDGFYSCLSDSSSMEFEKLKSDKAVPKTPISKTSHRQSDESKTPSRQLQDDSESDGFYSCLSDSSSMEPQKSKSGTAVPKTPINKTTHKQSDGSKTPSRHVQDDSESDGFYSCLSDSGSMEMQSLATAKPKNIVELEKIKTGAAVTKTPINQNTYMQNDNDSDEYFSCTSDSDTLEVGPPPPPIKPKNIVELEQKVKQGTNSCTIIPTTVPPVSKSVNKKAKTNSEQLPTILAASVVAAEQKAKLIEEQTLPKAVTQSQAKVMPVTLAMSIEPKRESYARRSRYSTPIDYQAMPLNTTKRQSRKQLSFNRGQFKPAEPIVADKATSTSYVSGRQIRNDMRLEIQEQLKELLQMKNTNAKHKYDAQERDEILMELHKLFNPEMFDLLPPNISREITLTRIRFIIEPERLSSNNNELTKLSAQQARILEDIRHIINPKYMQNDTARKFNKEFKNKFLEYMLFILTSRKQGTLADTEQRNSVWKELHWLLETGEVNRSAEQEQAPGTSQPSQQRSFNDIKVELMADLRYMLDAAPHNQGNTNRKEPLSNISSDDTLINGNTGNTNRKVPAKPSRRTFASIIFPKRYSERSATPGRRKTYRDLQSSSSEDFFLDMHDQ